MEANQEFTATTLERLQQASGACYRSDTAPYRAMWSRREPVSLFGALGPCRAGWPEVEATFRRMVQRRGHDHRLRGGARGLRAGLHRRL
jgi:hypothetical protein